ncbi:MAG TPA: hypothetical protein VLH81_04140, partial [Desulfobacterales bacterium]|nr:hypothetical protein [Desulfobacterales bacterium]
PLKWMPPYHPFHRGCQWLSLVDEDPHAACRLRQRKSTGHRLLRFTRFAEEYVREILQVVVNFCTNAVAALAC